VAFVPIGDFFKRGRFIQPESGRPLAQDVARVSNPIAEFAQDHLVRDPAATVECGKVFGRFSTWAETRGYQDLIRRTTRSNLTTQLKLVPGFGDLRSMKPYEQPRVYLGLRLKTKSDRDAEAQMSFESLPPKPLEPLECLPFPSHLPYIVPKKR
jgi:hypothetical protein